MNKKSIFLLGTLLCIESTVQPWGWPSITDIAAGLDKITAAANDPKAKQALMKDIQQLAVAQATEKVSDIPAVKAAQAKAKEKFDTAFPGVSFPVTTGKDGVPVFNLQTVEELQTKVDSVSPSVQNLLNAGSFVDVVKHASDTVNAIKDARTPEEKKEAILEAAAEIGSDQALLPEEEVMELAPLLSEVEADFAEAFPGQEFPVEKAADGSAITIDGQPSIDEVAIEKLLVAEEIAHPEVAPVEADDEAILHIRTLFDEAQNASTDKAKQIAFVNAMEAAAEEQILAPAAEAYGHLNALVEEALNGLKDYIPGAKAPVALAADGSPLMINDEPMLDPTQLHALLDTAEAMPDTAPITPAQQQAEDDWFAHFMAGDIVPHPPAAHADTPAELAAKLDLLPEADLNIALQDLGQHLSVAEPTGNAQVQPVLTNVYNVIDTLQGLLTQISQSSDMATVQDLKPYLKSRLIEMAGAL